MGMVGPGWKEFLRRHQLAVAMFFLAGALAVVGSIYVFFWFVNNAQSSGLVPSSLGLWTMGNLLTFILTLIFWEVILVGLPVILAAVVAWRWWRSLPMEERIGYHFGKRGRSTGGSGGVSLFFFIAFCIKVWLDGNWNVPISTFTLNYVVSSWFIILLWSLIIFGIPAAIGLAWWLNREMKKP
jgi:hypothetical protein